MNATVTNTAVRARLSQADLSDVGTKVRVPSYDRSKLAIGVAHIGVGAFHRCHQAEFLEDVAEAGFGQGIVGINLAPPEIDLALGPQDCLYSRTLAHGDERETRVIGVISKVLDYANSPLHCRNLIANPSIKTVTMTITEKGYCHIPSTGNLDESNANIVRDIANDLAKTTTVPGFIVASLAQRRANGSGPINLVSCDNIAGNGKVLSNVVLGLAGQVDPELQQWIVGNVAFPSTMVDRIVPASTEDDQKRVENLLGFSDAGAVLGEPFRQWVIEGQFATKHPNWEVAGVEIVGDVTNHEHIKMRVLNAAQTTLSLLGALRGLAFSADAVRDPDLSFFTSEMIRRETLPHLPDVAGMETRSYLSISMERISNRALRHRCHQIATDTSQKIRQRLLDPLRAVRNQTDGVRGLETAIAAWVVYLASAHTEFGARWEVCDPITKTLSNAGHLSGGDIKVFAHQVIAVESVFGSDLSRDAGFIGRIADRAAKLMGGQPPAVVAGYTS